MTDNEMYIPWILKSKILRGNRNLFLIIIILDIFAWIILTIKVGLFAMLLKDPGLYLHLPAIILVMIGSNNIFNKFSKIFNIDIYNGKINSEQSEEFRKVSDLFRRDEVIKYQHKLLKLIYNKKEKLFIFLGMSTIIILALFGDVVLTKNFGTIYSTYEYPWTIIASVVGAYFYWFLFISSFSFSLLWMLFGIIRGIELIGSSHFLKSISYRDSEENTISYKKFKHNIQPVSGMIYSISIVIMSISFIYTIYAIFINAMVVSIPMLYFFSFLIISIALATFIYPQLKIHSILKKFQKNILLYYNQIYDNLENNYFKIIEQNNQESFTEKENIKSDMYFIRDRIIETEQLDTWPYNISRLYKLIGASLPIIIGIFSQLLIN